jgi:hypothetical protein
MGVALLKKNSGGDDPRAALREAIRAAAEAHDMVEAHRQAVERALDMVSTAEWRATEAAQILPASGMQKNSRRPRRAERHRRRTRRCEPLV